MSVVVFSGPTLSAHDVRAILPNALVLGPAECGDVARAVRTRPRAIALIDGYFDHRLSVWHKEVLHALAQGVRVYGAASMGALRAAELDVYGMVGVGTVYDAYRSGQVEDDDEVAVAHEEESRGYATRCDAMVNIRATLKVAVEQGIVSAVEVAAVVAAGKALFYAERSFVLAVRSARGVSSATAEKLLAWVAREGVVDVKHSDAVALLQRIRSDLNDGIARSVAPNLRVEHTNYLDVLLRRLDAPPRGERARAPRPPAAPVPEALAWDAAPDELERLCDGDTRLAERVWRRALGRTLALSLANQQGASVSPEEAQAEADRFRRQRGLLELEVMEEWMREAKMDTEGFSRFVHDRVLTRRFSVVARSRVLAELEATWHEIVAESPGSEPPQQRAARSRGNDDEPQG